MSSSAPAPTVLFCGRQLEGWDKYAEKFRKDAEQRFSEWARKLSPPKDSDYAESLNETHECFNCILLSEYMGRHNLRIHVRRVSLQKHNV